jgi:hypothetical protein
MNPYVIRNGQRIEVEELNVDLTKKKKRREPFKAQWVKLPREWIEALRRSKSASAKQLAMEILLEAIKREQVGGEIILSSAITGMKRNVKQAATKELVKLGLIQTERKGNQAMRVSYLYYYKKEK